MHTLLEPRLTPCRVPCRRFNLDFGLKDAFSRNSVRQCLLLVVVAHLDFSGTFITSALPFMKKYSFQAGFDCPLANSELEADIGEPPLVPEMGSWSVHLSHSNPDTSPPDADGAAAPLEAASPDAPDSEVADAELVLEAEPDFLVMTSLLPEPPFLSESLAGAASTSGASTKRWTRDDLNSIVMLTWEFNLEISTS